MKPTFEVEALRGLAGAAHVSPADAATLLAETRIEPGHFAHQQHQALFAAMADLVRQGKPLDVVALKAVCGQRVPAALVVHVATEFELGVGRERLLLVREEARRRAVEAQLAGLLALAQRGGRVDAIVGEVHRVVAGLKSEADGVRTSEADVEALVCRVEAIQCGERPPVLSTGIEAMDFVCGGLQATLTVIGAMPGVGKSALLASIVGNLAKRGDKVGLISLEDERQWVTERLVSEESGVPLFVLGQRKLTDFQLERYAEASQRVYNMMRNVVIDDTHGLTPPQVVASARQMVAMGCKAVLVDHLGEVRLERSDRHDLDVTECLQALRGISKQYQVPVVVAAHMKRRDGLDDDKPPRLSDFAFSAGIERMARVALGLYRDKASVVRKLGVAVLKQTRGPSGFTFSLNMHERSGTVAPTEPTDGMREKYRWGDE